MSVSKCRSGILDLLEQRGVQFIDTFCVDNALARVAGPHFVAVTDMQRADVGKHRHPVLNKLCSTAVVSGH